MNLLAKDVARDVAVLLTSTDEVTGAAGLTLSVSLSKDGGAFASITRTVTDRGTGWYEISLTAADTDTLGDLCLYITASGANPLPVRYEVVPALTFGTVTPPVVPEPEREVLNWMPWLNPRRPTPPAIDEESIERLRRRQQLLMLLLMDDDR